MHVTQGSEFQDPRKGDRCVTGLQGGCRRLHPKPARQSETANMCAFTGVWRAGAPRRPAGTLGRVWLECRADTLTAGPTPKRIRTRNMLSRKWGQNTAEKPAPLRMRDIPQPASHEVSDGRPTNGDNRHSSPHETVLSQIMAFYDIKRE